MFRSFRLKRKRTEFVSQLNLKAPLAKGLEIKLAETAPEFIDAAKLLHNSYVRRQLIKGPMGAMRLSLYTVLPSTGLIVARTGPLLSGTVQVHQRTETNLPIEESFDISSILKDVKTGKDQRIIEIGSLALHDLKAARLEEVYLPLVSYIIRLCMTVLTVDRIVIAVQPRTAEFYEALFGFKIFKGGEAKRHSFAAGAEAVGLYLDLTDFRVFLEKNYRKLPPQQNLESFLLAHPDITKSMILPTEPAPAIHPKAAVILEEIYVNRSPMINNAPEDWRKNVATMYPDTDEYRWLFKSDDSIAKRQTRRHMTDFAVRLTDSFGLTRQGKAVDVSSGGMKIILADRTLPPSMDEELKVDISPPLAEPIPVITRVRRYDLKEYSLGVQVMDPSPEYIEFVEEVRGTALTTTAGTTSSTPKPNVKK
jgi:hypothetical protein